MRFIGNIFRHNLRQKNAKNSNSLKSRKVNDFWAENLAVWAEISAGECKVPIVFLFKAS